jgi:hypothetical protein
MTSWPLSEAMADAHDPAGASLMIAGKALEKIGEAGCRTRPKLVRKPRSPFRPPGAGPRFPRGPKVINPTNPRLNTWRLSKLPGR